MTVLDGFSYQGKRAAVVGGATGIGQAVVAVTKAAGADVVVLDRVAVSIDGVTSIEVDLADRASIELAVDKLGPTIDALFLCAGVADGMAGIERINFVGHRHFLERMMDRDMLPSGSAIGFISSTAGLGWEPKFMELSDLLDTSDFEEATTWMREHQFDNYVGSKQAVCAYVSREAMSFLKKGIRINALCPGPTDTPLARASDWLATGEDYRAAAGVPPATAMDQALPLVFLCSDAAQAITGTTVVVDQGRSTAGNTGSFPPATAAVSYLQGRPAAYQPAAAGA